MATDNRPESSTTNEQVRRAQEGDEGAIRDLYLSHRISIYQYLFYNVGDLHVAEDLTSEVFIRMLRALPSFKPRGSFQAWLYQIAHNVAMDYHRKEKGKTSLPFMDNLAADGSDPLDTVERQLDNQGLQKALAQLNQAQRDVLVLRFILGLSIQKTAQTLKCTEDAVKGLQRRGLIALRQILTERSDIHGKSREGPSGPT